MNKKRTRIFYVPLCLALLLFTAACGSSAEYEAASAEYAVTESAYYDNYESDYYEEEAVEKDSLGAAQSVDLSEKIIYSASASVETLDYEGSVDRVYALLDRYGAFLESSSVSGTDYDSAARGSVSARSAEFVIRVPVQNFAGIKTDLEEVGNVTWMRTWSENITSQFYDTQARKTAYETERDTLVAMLAQCDNVSDMIEVEARLSEVQYQIDSLASTLQNWQNRVDYSTLTLSLREVREYQEPVVVDPTYWERLSGSFMDKLDWLYSFLQGFSIVLICAVPVLILPALVLFLILRARAKKRKALGITASDQKEAKRAKKAQKKQRRRQKHHKAPAAEEPAALTVTPEEKAGESAD